MDANNFDVFEGPEPTGADMRQYYRRLVRETSKLHEELAAAHAALADALDARKELEDQLNQFRKLETVGLVASGIAHDFNNLLTIIRGHSELLASAIDHADPKHAGIWQIHEASRRATVLTRQLLAFSRNETIRPRLIAINDVLTELRPMLESLLGEDIAVQLRLDDDAALVMADQGQLDQVLINLAVNTRDAVTNGGTLSISTSNIEIGAHTTSRHEAIVPGSYVLISVSDNGCGMDTQTSARIFEPFFTTKPPGHGVGLGLSTVYGIIKQSGGYIWVDSTPGVGTTFNIYLPQASSEAAEEHTQASALATRGGTETVLVVEDDHALRSLSRQILARNGYTVLDAADGQEALHLANHYEGTLHLLIADIVMPGLSGPLLAERLLARRPQMRALFMSGYPNDDISRRGMRDAGAPFLQKPFTAAGLLGAARDTIDGRRPNDD